MAIDELYVLNLALAHLGETEADDLNPETMKNATRKVRRHLPFALEAVLSRHPWTCVTVRAEIQASGEVPGDFRYAYAYALPGDALRVFAVEADWHRLIWQATSAVVGGSERRVVRCNAAGPVHVTYVRRGGWLALFPALIDAIALECAARACQPINGDIQRAAQLKVKADQAVDLAIGFDATQSEGDEPLVEDTLFSLRASC